MGGGSGTAYCLTYVGGEGKVVCLLPDLCWGEGKKVCLLPDFRWGEDSSTRNSRLLHVWYIVTMCYNYKSLVLLRQLLQRGRVHVGFCVAVISVEETTSGCTWFEPESVAELQDQRTRAKK